MNYRDPVSNRAIGAFDKELKKAARDGQRLLMLRRNGLLTRREEERVRSRYKGLCLRRLEAAMNGLLPGGDGDL